MNSNTIYNTNLSKVEADRISREKEFTRRSKERFGDKFDYSLVNYINNSTSVTLICEVHGEIQDP